MFEQKAFSHDTTLPSQTRKKEGKLMMDMDRKSFVPDFCTVNPNFGNRRILYSSKLNVSFCAISKNMNTVAKSIFCYLHDPHRNVALINSNTYRTSLCVCCSQKDYNQHLQIWALDAQEPAHSMVSKEPKQKSQLEMKVLVSV